MGTTVNISDTFHPEYIRTLTYNISNNSYLRKKLKIIKQLLFYLKVSRPGLWFATGWLYLLPTSQMEVWESPAFWFGYFYVSFPLNFLVYGWNDVVDQETDALNPRKDTFWFGARGSAEQLRNLWKPILLVQVLCLPFLIYWAGWGVLILLLLFVLINGLYNLPKNGLRGRPPFELSCLVGYLLIVPLSVWLNETPSIPIYTYVYLLLFSIQSHLMGEVMDIEPDRKAGRKTTATQLGMKKTKILIMFIVAMEVSLLFYVYQEYIFGSLLLLGLLWLIIDLFFVFKTQTYTLAQMKLFGLGSNAIAMISMVYVWYSGCLLG